VKYHYYTSNVVRHRRCERYIGDEGRDNRKSAAAGAKDGQFSGGFVTRESLHGGQWPHPSFVSRASSPPAPPGYLLPRLPRITSLFVPHIESSTTNASHDGRLCMDLQDIRQSDQLSPKSTELVGPLSFSLSRSRALRARPRGSVSGSERSVKGRAYVDWINMRGRRTRIVMRRMP